MSIARQLLDRYFAAALAEDSDTFAALFVDGGLLAYPFSKLQFVGTRAIAERTQRMWAAWPFTPTRYEVTALIECESGLTAEYIVHGTVDATGAALEIGSIAVLDVDCLVNPSDEWWTSSSRRQPDRRRREDTARWMGSMNCASRLD